MAAPAVPTAVLRGVWSTLWQSGCGLRLPAPPQGPLSDGGGQGEHTHQEEVGGREGGMDIYTPICRMLCTFGAENWLGRGREGGKGGRGGGREAGRMDGYILLFVECFAL